MPKTKAEVELERALRNALGPGVTITPETLVPLPAAIQFHDSLIRGGKESPMSWNPSTTAASLLNDFFL